MNNKNKPYKDNYLQKDYKHSNSNNNYNNSKQT